LTCCQKFALYAALYIGVLDRIVVGKDSNTFLVCIKLYLSEDSEEIGKGINAVSNDRLNGYDNGFRSG
jgi:hypothetical protein